MTQKGVAAHIFELLPLKMKNASQVCCLATRPGGLLSFRFNKSVFVRCCKDSAFFSIHKVLEWVIFRFSKFSHRPNSLGIPLH